MADTDTMQTNHQCPPLRVGDAPFDGKRVMVTFPNGHIDTWTPIDGIYCCECCGNSIRECVTLLDLEVVS